MASTGFFDDFAGVWKARASAWKGSWAHHQNRLIRLPCIAAVLLV
jgi:hypothetical protein